MLIITNFLKNIYILSKVVDLKHDPRREMLKLSSFHTEKLRHMKRFSE